MEGNPGSGIWENFAYGISNPAWALKSGIMSQGIQNATDDWNPESKLQCQKQESRT